jgi:glycosyltransferase involved in cell wall biosynthesis
LQSEPELTVIMPVYNVAQYLGRALDALLNQQDPNFKLLIVDDGSTDSTAAVAQSYAGRFKWFRMIEKANSGVSDTRNVGLAHVDTPLFTFHDGDDWTDPGYTAFFKRAFKQHPEVDLVSCGYYISYPTHEHRVGWPQSGNLTRWQTYKKMTNVFNSPVKGYAWNKAYRTQVVRENKLHFIDNLPFMEDQIFNVYYEAVSRGFYYTATPYYHYFQRSGSLVHKAGLETVPDNIRVNYIVWKKIFASLRADRRQRKAARDLESKNESSRQWH